MLNKDGIIRKKYAAPVQILANVELQYSVGCRVPASMGVDVGDGIKIVKAGTPIGVNLNDINANVTTGQAINAVLLHNVDVTNVKEGGSANGTALLFGFVNLNRLEEDVVNKINLNSILLKTNSKFTFIKL